MILSRTAVYALKAALHLAEIDGAVLLRVDDIADALGVPRNYLSKILHSLARAGILHSTRGPGGGFRLAQPAATIKIAEVIAPFDDIATNSGCLLGREQCSDHHPCAAHARWNGVSASVRDFLRETSLADFSENPTLSM